MLIRVLRCRLNVLVLLLCLGVTPLSANDADFPEYESIRPNVEFWTRVFAEWSQGQVVVHDLEYPAIVYDHVALPGSIEERYNGEQADFVEDLNELWQDRLEGLERKLRDGNALSEAEKVWALQIATHAGGAAVEDAHERVRTQRGLRERFLRGVEISSRYEARIRAIFREADLPEDLAYLPHVESSYQAAARSSAGAVGVWQFTRGTGKLYLRINAAIDERLDPIAAAHGAAAYLRDAYDKLGDWPIALTSYNHGVVGMSRAVRKLGVDYERIFLDYDGRSFGFASKNFYSEFLAARAIAREPERFFPGELHPEPPLDLESVLLDRRATVAGIARAYGMSVDDLAALNPAWSRRAVRSGLALPAGSSVWLPAGTLAAHGGEARLPRAGLYGHIDDEGLYVVERGDTLSAIAVAHGVSLGRLREWNDLSGTESLIRVGQRLRIVEPGAEDEKIVHVVRSGETLSSIARSYGMSIDSLRRLNGLEPAENLIRVGQRLLVNAATVAAFYIVQRGDTLLEIALRHGVKLSTLLSANRLSERAIIKPGQRIRVPVTY
jgi:membrane-bound lytic murein transglycosylase D